MDKNLENRLEIAKQVAKIAGDYALSKRDSNDFEVSQKSLNDFVTTADKETEALIFSELNKAFPQDGFYGEESKEVSGKGRWVVDPIDGTTNYFRNLPNWVVSIAYEREYNKPLIGVIYAPCLNEMYYAMKGFGSYKNGKKIHTSNIGDIKFSINVCVPPHRYKELYADYMNKFNIIGTNSSDLRSLGSCALELCYIASGYIDGYYELKLGYYDFAAGIIILEEAGGKYTIPHNNSVNKDDRIDLIATNGKLHSWFEKVIL
jgi:myo-inositol-1(or 4)-monophosphatase